VPTELAPRGVLPWIRNQFARLREVARRSGEWLPMIGRSKGAFMSLPLQACDGRTIARHGS
jgi:hypothetical protein